MENNEENANQLMEDAKKKLTSYRGFFTSLLVGDTCNNEDAAECYERAGNMFKIIKHWSQAGKAFFEAAELSYLHDAATYYVTAANCFKKTDTTEAINCFLKAIEKYTELGRYTMVAKYYQSVAELYDNEINDMGQALQYYEKAADFYNMDDSTRLASNCMLKVAQYAAQLEDYEKAIQIYEEVAGTCLNIPILMYSVREYFFKAALCHLCVDLLNAQQALVRYLQRYPAFEDSREYKLVKVLCEHLNEQNMEGFTNSVAEYDKISKFDNWCTTILLRIKRGANTHLDLK